MLQDQCLNLPYLWKRSCYLSVCANASWSSVVWRCVCPRQRETGSRSSYPGLQAKNDYLSLSAMNSGSESQSLHNITTSIWLLNNFWRYCWISVVLLSQTSFHTQSTVGKTSPWQCDDCSCQLNLKRQQPMRKSLGKSNPFPLKIGQSGGNASPIESSPPSGVGGVSGLGQG